MHPKSFILNQKNHNRQRFIQSVYKRVHQTSSDSPWTKCCYLVMDLLERMSQNEIEKNKKTSIYERGHIPKKIVVLIFFGVIWH